MPSPAKAGRGRQGEREVLPITGIQTIYFEVLPLAEIQTIFLGGRQGEREIL